jgi:hypothetical protein
VEERTGLFRSSTFIREISNVFLMERIPKFTVQYYSFISFHFSMVPNVDFVPLCEKEKSICNTSSLEPNEQTV